MKRLLFLLLILPALVMGQGKVRYKQVTVDSNMILNYAPTDTSELILVLSSDGKLRTNRDAGGSEGASIDSLAFYVANGAAWQRDADDSVVINNKLTGKYGYLWGFARSATTPATSYADVYLNGTAGTALLKAAKHAPPFSNSTVQFTLSPANAVAGFSFQTDEFGTFAYQVDEFGFYPTDYTTAGDYNQYLGIPTHKWKRAYIDTLNITGPGFFGSVHIGGTTTPDSTLKVTGSVNVTTNLKAYKVTSTIDALLSGVTAGKGNNSTSTAFGVNALKSNISGSIMGARNVAVGYEALYSNTDEKDNVAVGYKALREHVNGRGNTAVGASAMSANNPTINNTYNTGIGGYSLQSVKDGSNNTAVGYSSAWKTYSASGNTVVGYEALSENTSGSYNIALGHQAGNAYSGLSYRMYLGGSDSTAKGIYWNLTTGINKGYWNGAMRIKTAPYSASAALKPLVIDTTNGDVYHSNASTGGTPYTATSPVDITGTVVSIKTDTLAAWYAKMNRWPVNGTSTYYNTGNVGINTSTPAEKLHVNGDAKIEDTLIFQSPTGDTLHRIYAYNGRKLAIDSKTLMLPNLNENVRTHVLTIDTANGTVGYQAMSTFANGNSDTTSLLLWVGDSMLRGGNCSQPPTSDSVNVPLLNGCTFEEHNISTGGYEICEADSLYAKALLNYYHPRGVNVMVVWLGINDFIQGRTAGETFACLEGFCVKYKALGYRVIVATLPSSNGRDALRNEYNRLIRLNWTRFADRLADIGAEAHIGVDGSYADNTLFCDGLHLTILGNDYAAAVLQTAVDDLILNQRTLYAANIEADTVRTTALQVGNYNVTVTGNVSIPQSAVTSVATTSPLTGGTITSTGTVSIIADTLTSWRDKQNKGATAYGWGDHAGMSYLTSILGTSPVVITGSKTVTIHADTLTSWRSKQNQGATAYGWGNWAGHTQAISTVTNLQDSLNNRYRRGDTATVLLGRTRAASTYEPKIAAGTTAQYWRGDKTWQSLGTWSQWTTNGTSVYYNTGSVGIGTSAPAAKFHVSGSATGQLSIITNSIINKNQTTGAQATDTCASYWYLWPSGKISWVLKGATGNVRLNADTNNVFTVGDTLCPTIIRTPAGSTMAIVNQSNTTDLRFNHYGYAPKLRFYRINGTFTSPSGVVADNVIGEIDCGGQNSAGSASNQKARLYAIATQTWDASKNGTKWYFLVTPNDSATARQRLEIADAVTVGTTGNLANLVVNGKAGIGTTNPMHMAEIVSSATNRYAFNTYFSGKNKNATTIAQARDTSSFNVSFTPIGRPELVLKGNDSIATFKVDSLGQVRGKNLIRIGGCIVDSARQVTTGFNKIYAGYTPFKVIIDSIFFTGYSGSPNITLKVGYGSDMSAAGTTVISAGTAVTSGSSTTRASTFDNATIPAGSTIWVWASAVTTKNNQIGVNIWGRRPEKD